ncbi:MAG: R3H domain-containing nucleic acid-binding protein [Candidatus Paceibacterota bacterium]|jgi:predicted RNA-binding protein Jag
MDKIIEKTKQLMVLMGFPDVEVALDEERRKVIILIQNRFVEENVETILPALDHLINLIIRKEGLIPYVVDLNYYRKERERLIVELARAAARKAVVMKQNIDLPPMNGYERRLVHMEITTHPELKTESAGVGKDRHVIIKQVEEIKNTP